MKRKKNGFTLVELLVTIAIMLTILIISIVSIVNLNDKKKESAWNQVQEEVKTAAEQYFSSNEYYLQDIDNSSVFVSVGTLVKEDYLNKVTNPLTGKNVNSCDLVYVSKVDGDLVYNYCDSDDENCKDAKEQMKVSDANCTMNEPVAVKTTKTTAKTTTNSSCPKWSYSTKATAKNGWYYGNVTAVAKYSDGTIAKNSNGNNCECELEETGFCECTMGNKKCDSEKVNIDKSEPQIKINLYKGKSLNEARTNQETYTNNTWLSGYVYLEVEFKAGTSGQKSGICTYKNSEKSGTFKSTLSVSTEGTTTINCSLITNSGKEKKSSTYTVKLDRTKPVCKASLSTTGNGKKLNKVGNRQWYKNKFTYKATCSDSLSGCNSKSDNYNLDTYNKNYTGEGVYTFDNVKIADKAGNKTNCTTLKAGIENSVKLEFNKDSTNKDAKKDITGTSKVFNTDKTSVCGFGSCTYIKMYDGNTSSDNNIVSKDLFARACKNVTDYYRYFKVTARSVKDGKFDRYASADKCGDCNSNEKLKRTKKWQINGVDNIKNKYNISSGSTNLNKVVTASKDRFTYTSPAGNTASVDLYVEYVGDCGY